MKDAQEVVAQAVGVQDIVSTPIARIRVANPRVRSRKVFAGMVHPVRFSTVLESAPPRPRNSFEAGS